MTMRNKTGMLEMFKKDGMRKIWKPYTFKVSASTYLLCFKDNMAKPHGQILLAEVVRVAPSPAKGASFPFEVHFRGKGSPWVLNASCNEERMEWMDTIQPGSSLHLKQFSIRSTSPPMEPHLPYPTTGPHSPPDPTQPQPQPYGQPAHQYQPQPQYRQPPSQPQPPQPQYRQPPPQPQPPQPQYHQPPPQPQPPQPQYRQPPPQPQPPPRYDQPASQYGPPMPQPPPRYDQPASRYGPPMPQPPPRSDQPQPPYRQPPYGQPPPQRNQPQPQAQIRSQYSYLQPYPNGDLSTSVPENKPSSSPRARSPFREAAQRGSGVNVDPSQSWPLIGHPSRMPPQPQDYLAPVSMQQQLTHSISSPPESGPVPTKRKTVGHSPRPSPRRPHRTSTEPNLRESLGDDSYVLMESSPARVPSPRSPPPQADVPDGHEYMIVCPDTDPDMPVCPIIDDDNYVTVPTTPTKPPPRPQPKPRASSNTQSAEGGTFSQMVDKMAQSFNPDQLGMLIHMLQEIQTSKDTGPVPVVYEAADPATLRGNLQRVLSHAPELSDNILITDDDDFYEPRPEWAKAAANEDRQNNQDTLSELEEEALRIPRDDLEDFEQIGEGQFGKVFKATLKRGPGGGIPVAVKTTKKSSSEADKASFLREMNIMSQMVHPNIVKLYGLITEDVPSPWIVLEYLPHGDLKNFLKKNKRPVQQLVKYMIDVAMGMHYISERGLIHRDLAARNILVGEGELCKVADFGLLRELPKDESIYHSQSNIPCPVRWMPPEAVTDRSFSPASDVWSFGILMWEMFNPNKLPYDKFSNIECITKVIQGYRLPVPRECPSMVVRIMKACWHQSPTKRPSFLLISTFLSTKVTFNY